MENVVEKVHVRINESFDSNVESQTGSEAPTKFLSPQPVASGSKDHDPPTLEPTGDGERVTVGPKQADEDAKSSPENVSLDETVMEEIDVDRRYHIFFFHNRANLMRKIYRENGGVHITFPPYGSDSSKVLLEGAKRHVNTAKLAISEIVADLEDHAVIQSDETVMEEIIVDPRLQRFFFHNRANLIRKIYRENGGVHITFPPSGSDSCKVLLEGAKRHVNTAKLAISEVAAELARHVVIQCDETVTEEMDVDRKHQIFSFHNRANLIEKISLENGGVLITFPPAGSDSSKVVLEGAKRCVNKAKLTISEVVANLESHVMIQCAIPRKYHGKVIGFKGVNTQALSQEYNVDIAFPERAAKSAVGVETGTGSGGDNKASAIEDATDPRDVVTITGREENCLKVKEALLDLVPREIAVDVPFWLHSAIFGQHYENVRSFGPTYGVWIDIPHPRLQKDCVYVRGAAGNCEQAKEALLKFVEQSQEEIRAYMDFLYRMATTPYLAPNANFVGLN